MTETLQTTLMAPIPVGHRVRATWYVLRTHGLFGGSSDEELPYEPVLEDLDTGIVYSSERVWDHGSGKRPDIPLEVGDRQRGVPHRVVEGVVRACRVVTIRGYGEVDIQTRLVVETP